MKEYFCLGECDQGYFCIGGAYLPDPDDNVTGVICPRHHVCTQGTTEPEFCANGYYANNTGMWECENCPAGFLCIAGEAPRICPQGNDREQQQHLIVG